MRFLWADDQLNVVTTLAGLLRERGDAVEFASSGEEALMRLGEGGIDLVLVDLAMPPGAWGGLWLLEAMKNRNINVPAIVVSGEGSQSETIQALRLGAMDYVLKERLEEELGDRINAVFAAANERDENVTRKLIEGGESDAVEFKSTLRWNLKANRADLAVELAVFKTIAAFLNSSGGTLIVGVADDHTIMGLASDGFENVDKLQLHFWNRVRDALGAGCIRNLSGRIVFLDGKSVFRVECRKSDEPVYVQWKSEGGGKSSEMFFVRAGPRTEQLGLRDTVRYVKEVFGR